MRISDWSSDVCSSDLGAFFFSARAAPHKKMARPRAARGGPVSVPGRRIAPAGPLIIPSFLEQVDRVGGGRRKPPDRTSVGEGKSGSVSVDPGGRHNLKQTKKEIQEYKTNTQTI